MDQLLKHYKIKNTEWITTEAPIQAFIGDNKLRHQSKNVSNRWLKNNLTHSNKLLRWIGYDTDISPNIRHMAHICFGKYWKIRSVNVLKKLKNSLAWEIKIFIDASEALFRASYKKGKF